MLPKKKESIIKEIIMINKIKKKLFDHKTAIFIFIFFAVYNILIVEKAEIPAIDEITYTYHIVDYTIGFCTKLLPGAIYNFLFPTTDAVVVNIYFFVLYHIFLVAVSLLLEKLLKDTPENSRMFVLILIMFFITGPSTFSGHIYRFGMLDTYWLFFTVLFVVFLKNKYLKWAVPVFFVLALLIHVSALVSFIPFFALLVLLEASKKEKADKGTMAIFAVSVVVALGAGLYFVVNESDNIVLSRDAFLKLLEERNISEWESYKTYYDYSIYRTSYLDEETNMGAGFSDNGGLLALLSPLIIQIKETFAAYSSMDSYFEDSFRSVALSLPVIIFLYMYAVSSLKESRNNPVRWFTWLCTLFLLPLVFISGILCSPDITRWFSHSVITLFIVVLYDIYSTGAEKLQKYLHWVRLQNIPVLTVYFLLYMSYTVDPYC